MKQGLQYEANQMVNKIGKYLYKYIDGAFKFKISSNMCDVYLSIYYQEPGQDLEEMQVDLNITTYQNKIRVNLIEITPQERTIGYDVYKPEDIRDLEYAKYIILKNVRKRIERAYEHCQFVY